MVVDEGEERFTVCAKVEPSGVCALEHEFVVFFSALSGTAGNFHWLYFSHFSLPVVAPDDFASILTTLTFDPCKTRACVDVHIENDCDVEQDEYLIAALGTVLYTERVYVSKIPTKVHIIDDDSKIPKCWGKLSYALKSLLQIFL